MGSREAVKMETKTIIIMMGLQGSGKSEYCRRYLAEGFVRVNLDTLHTRNNERALLETCFAGGENIVVDNTNPTKADRARYIAPAKEHGYRVAGVFMESKIKDCVARNELREGKAKVPAKAIAATMNRLEMPSRAEGFDELWFVHNDGVTMTKEEWRE